MKKKYPKEWFETTKDALQQSFDLGKASNGGFILITKEEIAESMFDLMDAAGMLREPPEPLEIEYCTVHGSQRAIVMGSEFSKCEIGVRYLAPTHNLCEFKKMREVEE